MAYETCEPVGGKVVSNLIKFIDGINANGVHHSYISPCIRET